MTDPRLERYRPLVPRWDELLRVVSTPEPTHVRVRSGRDDPRDVVARLEARGFGLRPVGGLDGVYLVEEAPFPVSNTLEHWAGLLYVQQAATATAAPALDPRPGERVLDMAAAPGGKTTHIADLMDDRGCLVASDRNEKRQRALLANIYRTAHPGVTVVAADGRGLQGEGLFDRVLLDAPCSGEGNLRGRGGELPTPSKRFADYVPRLQEELLRRAVALCRPGGVVLYSTCTFNPLENEAVVDAVLRDAPVRVEAIPLDVPHAPGATGFEGRRFHPDLEAAWRIYPHHLDSGGLFLARLRKDGDAAVDAAAWEPIPAAHPGEDEGPARARVGAARDMLEEEWGVPRARLDALRWMVRGDSVWATTADAWPPGLWEGGGRRFVALGLRATKDDGRQGERPTNDFLAWLGPDVRRRTLDLDEDDVARALAREPVAVPEELAGFVVLRLLGRVLGRAVVRHGRLIHHEIPKARAAHLRDVLAARRPHATGATPG